MNEPLHPSPPGTSSTAAAPTAGASLRALLLELQTSAGALAALAAALHERSSAERLPGELSASVDEVLCALGARELVERLVPSERRSLLGELRTLAATDGRLASGARASPGWTPTDAELIGAAGDVSSELARTLQRSLAPLLPGLSERLGGPAASFLDVGAGSAALSLEMARTFPELRVVGLEPWAPAVAIARDNVREAGLERRVELRELRGEQLFDESCFDLAWIPTFFIPAPVLQRVLERVLRALRPGAWLLLPVLVGQHATLRASVLRLRVSLWGGSALTFEDARGTLQALGFRSIHTLPSSPTAMTGLVAARR
jgi:hypothetical protein